MESIHTIESRTAVTLKQAVSIELPLMVLLPPSVPKGQTFTLGGGKCQKKQTFSGSRSTILNGLFTSTPVSCPKLKLGMWLGYRKATGIYLPAYSYLYSYLDVGLGCMQSLPWLFLPPAFSTLFSVASHVVMDALFWCDDMLKEINL